MQTKLWILCAGLATIVAGGPLASAHPFGTPIDNPNNGRRCYYYDDHDTNTRQIWLEANGVLDRGEAEAQEWFGLPPLFDGPGSGLQRSTTPGTDGILGTSDDVPPDALLDSTEVVQSCT